MVSHGFQVALSAPDLVETSSRPGACICFIIDRNSEVADDPTRQRGF